MSKIVLDPTLRARLNGLSEPMEVCDEAGATVGHFLPVEQYRKLMYQLAEAACPHSPEQLEQLQKETGGKSLQEIWKSLGVS